MKLQTILLILLIACVPLAAVAAVAAGIAADKVVLLLGLMGLVAVSDYAVQDASTDVYDSSTALPNGALTTYSATFDLGAGENVIRPPNLEVVVVAPLLATGVMGDGKYIYYDIYHDTDSAMGTEALLLRMGFQLGASSAGCAAKTLRCRLPATCNRYIRVKATGSTTGDCSGSTFSARLLF
jgi:hypothetical protein